MPGRPRIPGVRDLQNCVLALGATDGPRADASLDARAACGPRRNSLVRPCGEGAIMRPVNRDEAGGAPAIGIEARKGRDPARRDSVRSTRARPEGIAPILPGERSAVVRWGTGRGGWPTRNGRASTDACGISQMDTIASGFPNGGRRKVSDRSKHFATSSVKAVFDTRPDTEYDDDVVRRYHFPNRYLSGAQRTIGDWVVYREPRRGGGRKGYVAVARVTRAIPDPSDTGSSYAHLADYLSFDVVVPLHRKGRYYEARLATEGFDVDAHRGLHHRPRARHRVVRRREGPLWAAPQAAHKERLSFERLEWESHGGAHVIHGLDDDRNVDACAQAGERSHRRTSDSNHASLRKSAHACMSVARRANRSDLA